MGKIPDSYQEEKIYQFWKLGSEAIDSETYLDSNKRNKVILNSLQNDSIIELSHFNKTKEYQLQLEKEKQILTSTRKNLELQAKTLSRYIRFYSARRITSFLSAITLFFGIVLGIITFFIGDIVINKEFTYMILGIGLFFFTYSRFLPNLNKL